MTKAGYSPLKDQGLVHDPCPILPSRGEGIDVLSKRRAPASQDQHGASRSDFPCQAMTCCSPRLGNESFSAAGLGKERESTQSKQYTELLPTPGEQSTGIGTCFYRAFLHAVQNAIKFYLSSAVEAVLY